MRDDAFWARVDQSGGPDACWPWAGSKARFGHGQVRRRPRILATHRYAWELTQGAIPDGFNVCHSCDNPPCCNPAHLFLGTQRDNVRDMIAKGRSTQGKHQRSKTHCRHGHEFTPENTYLYRGVHRHCLECSRSRGEKARKANPEKAREIWRRHREKRRAS